jgi:hypothetical protein
VTKSVTPLRPGAPDRSHRHQGGGWCGDARAPDPGWCGGGEPPKPWCGTARPPVKASTVKASTVEASTGVDLLTVVAALARALGKRRSS